MTLRPGPALLAAALALLAGAAGAEFADPLDTPAMASALAAQQPVNGLARAGTRLVAAGQRGHVLYSDDEGASWTQAQVPVRSDLTAIAFGDARHGWAVGHDGVVLATTDAGATWSKQLDGRALGPLLLRHYVEQPPQALDEETLALLLADAERIAGEGPDKPFLGVWFEDARRGYVVGAFGLILRTEDGGASWTPWLDRVDNPRAQHLYAVGAAAGEVFIAGEQGLLLRLDHEARRFRALESPYRGTLFGIAGTGDAVLVFGLRGNVWRSIDGGGRWTRLDSGVEVSLSAATRDAQGRTVLASQTGHLLAVDGDRLQPLAAARRVPATAVLALPDGGFVVGGPRGLHRLAPPATGGGTTP